MLHKISLFIAVLLMVNLSAGGANSATNKLPKRLEDKLIVIATGGIAGVYYPVGGALCRVINKERNALGIRCSVESTPGSVYNLNGLRKLEFDFAIVQSDWEEHAFNGTGAFLEQGRFEKLRRVIPLHHEAFTVLVRRNSEIKTLDNLKNHKINLGPIGSGGRATMQDVMRAKGWTERDFKSFTSLTEDEQGPALCSGGVDAIVMTTGHPNGLVGDISKMCEIRILTIRDDIVDKFIAGNPEFSHTTIAGGLYTGVPTALQTFGTRAMLVTTSDVSDNLVYDITKAIFENFSAFKALHPVLQNLTPQNIIQHPQISPYHPGALQYFNEKGFMTERLSGQ
jgi:TRAP transporter TAXI family solute receptor